jgi:hypothetical protein
MNPFDALLVPPALVKRALDDLHDIAQLARSYTEIEDEIRELVAGIEQQIAGMRTGVDALLAEVTLLRAVLESVDELEPMISDLDAKIRRIEPKLDAMHESVEPIGDLAEKIPGNRRRR